MTNRINVAVTGFVGSGSSAVIDLLKEFDVCENALGKDKPYEHIPLYTHNGLLELGSILQNVNSPHNSDMAINGFIDSMERLNNNNFGWYGSYKWYVGDKFQKATQDFVSSISKVVDGKTCEHTIKVKWSLIKVILQIAAKIVYKRPIPKLGRVYVYDKKPVYYSMPTSEEYYLAARKFINSYFEMCSTVDKQVMVYDHLIWPQHAKLVDDYFGDNFKVIIVLRDARDMFTLNKYYLYCPPIGNGKPLFPTEPKEFCEYWRRVNHCVKGVDSNKILYLNFEDLVYNYDEALNKIIKFIGLKEINHVNKNRYFDPSKSIKNTQTFYINNEYYNESKIIEKEIPNHLYNFPYKIKTSFSEMFDDPNYVTKSKKDKKDKKDKKSISTNDK